MNTIPLLFTIDPNTDTPGILLNETKNRAIISMQNPIDLSRIKNPRLSLQAFSCFFTFPNIESGSKFVFSSSLDGVSWTEIDEIEVDQGLYSSEGLAEFLSSAVTNSTDLQNEFTGLSVNLVGNYNTEKVDITATSVDITVNKQLKLEIIQASFIHMLGFSEMIWTTTGKQSAPNQAHFNTVNSLVLSTSLLSFVNAPSIFNNKGNLKMLENVVIDAEPGDQIMYRSPYPSHYKLSPVMVNDIEIVILNEKLQNVRMTNIYSIFMVITFDDD